jgi:hypothetical protein
MFPVRRMTCSNFSRRDISLPNRPKYYYRLRIIYPTTCSKTKKERGSNLSTRKQKAKKVGRKPEPRPDPYENPPTDQTRSSFPVPKSSFHLQCMPCPCDFCVVWCAVRLRNEIESRPV